MIGALIAKSKVTSSYDLLNAKNIEKFLANWHEECVWRFPGNLSISGEFRGKKAVKEWFERLVNQFPRFVLTPKHVCVKNLFDFVGTNVVTVNFTEEITDNDGNEYKFDGLTVVTLKLGKATHAEDYFFNTADEIRKAWGE